MNPDPEERTPHLMRGASIFLKTSLLMIALFSCHKLDKSNLRIAPVTESKKEIVVSKHDKPPAKKKKKKIYLTFDDGPNKGTQKVLNIMQQEEVPVSFFVVGEHVFASPAQQKVWDSLSMAKQIELCNHSYTHGWHNRYETYYNNPDSVVSDFAKCRDSLGLNNNIGRTPGRNTWRIDTLRYTDLKKTKAAVDSLQTAGFAIMGWDLEWHYSHKELSLENTADDLLRQIDSLFAQSKTKVQEHLVILAHDQVYADANDSMELHKLIKMLKRREEYEFELASKYPGVRQ